MTSFRLHPSVPSHFVVLWLIILYTPFAYGVCQNCFGAAQGCGGNTTACPWVTTVATNVAAMAAAAGGAIKVLNVLPHKILRLFPKSILDILSSVAARDLSTTFDPTNKSTAEIVTAVKFGHFSQLDAILHFTDEISKVANGDGEASVKIKKLESAIKSIESISSTTSVSPNTNEGCLLYILARLSKSVCVTTQGSTSFDLCGDCENDDDSTRSQKSFSATLVRPQTIEQMISLLNLFTMVGHATGAANVIAITCFLDEVVFDPMRVGNMAWPVAFECMILYLRMVEAHGSNYNIASIVHTCGGIDAIRQEATSIAHDRYPSAFFRSPGGKPGMSNMTQAS